MAPAQVPAEGHASISLTMTEAKDQLWAYQLRKENKAMLQEIRELQERRQNDHAEFERSYKVTADQLAAVEARIIELERKSREDGQQQEKFREDIAALQSLVADNMARKYPDDEVRYILEGGLNPLCSVPNTPNRSPPSDRRPADPRQRRNVRIAERNLSRGEDNPLNRLPPDPIRKPQAHVGSSERSRYATRSRTRIESPPSTKPVNAIRVSASASKSRIPKLDQGNRSMRDYFTNANVVYQSLQSLENDARFDIEFVNSFLRGLRIEKTKDKLVDELRQFHPSRVMKDRWVEVTCGWADVEDAIRRGGLFVEVEKMANKRQGRIMNPRTMVETDI